MELKRAPDEMKTSEKPRTKANDPRTVRARPPAAPLRNPRYPGTKGKTQGDKNDTSPATKAMGIPAMSEAGSVAITTEIPPRCELTNGEATREIRLN